MGILEDNFGSLALHHTCRSSDLTYSNNHEILSEDEEEQDNLIKQFSRSSAHILESDRSLGLNHDLLHPRRAVKRSLSNDYTNKLADLMVDKEKKKLNIQIKAINFHSNNEDVLATGVISATKSQEQPQPVIADFYQKEYEESKWRYRYYRYINPWIRFLILIPILYFYAVCSAILTYRNNTFVGLMKDFGQHPHTFPLQINDDVKPFILRDLMFEIVPPAHNGNYKFWEAMADFCPIAVNIILLVLLTVRRDVVRWSEYLGIQMIMFFWNAIAHLVTTLPDSGGVNEACLNSDFSKFGWNWFLATFATTYCGDMIWSGHTANTLLPVIMIRRLIWDYLGWSFNVHDNTEVNLQSSNNSKTKSKKAQQSENRFGLIDRVTDAVNDLLNSKVPLLNTFSKFKSDGGRSCDQSPQSDINHLSAVFLTQHDHPQQFLQYLQHATNRALILSDVKSDYLRQVRSRQSSPAIQPISASTTVTPPFCSKDPSALIDSINSPFPSPLSPPPLHLDSKATPRSLLHDSISSAVHAVLNPLLSSSDDTEAMARNTDSDLFFIVRSSPYVTSSWAFRHREICAKVFNIIRIILPIWFCVLLYSLILIRSHYSVDLVIAVLVTLLVSSNATLCQWLVRMIYRPYYHNYRYNQFWKPVYLNWPLNEEQINYEERVRRVGQDGYL
jgi:hypothetical protein